VESLGVPTQFIPHNKPDVILARIGLDTAGITAAATRLVQ
jgi:deoxyxylulose-5-phosphate synthase